MLSRCDISHKLCLLENINNTEEVLRKSLCMAAMLLPLFAVMWFLGVLAFENSTTLVFPVLFAAADTFLVSKFTAFKAVLFHTKCIHDYKLKQVLYNPCMFPNSKYLANFSVP
jgi:hypothetical protein